MSYNPQCALITTFGDDGLGVAHHLLEQRLDHRHGRACVQRHRVAKPHALDLYSELVAGLAG